MNHLYFGLYLISLGFGFITISALANNPRFRLSPGFVDVVLMYLLVTLCVCVTTLWLYVYINVTTNIAIVNTSYLSFVLLFLAAVPVFALRANTAQYHYKPSIWSRWLINAGIAYGVVAAASNWIVAAQLRLPLVYLGISFMLINIAHIALQTHTHRKHTSQDKDSYNKQNRISMLMLVQSLGLSLGEIALRLSYIRDEGMIYSLPLIYAINIGLLWLNRERFFSKPTATNAIDKRLSPKEQQIALAIAEGLSNKQIAARLAISPSTVKNHIYNIFKKCNVTNRVALIAQTQETKPR